MLLLKVGLWIVAAMIMFSMLTGVASNRTPARQRVTHVSVGMFILAVVIAAALTIQGAT